MPGITLRKDGRYVIRKMLNGVRKVLYAKTLTEAKKILQKFNKNQIEIIPKHTSKINKYEKYTLKEWIKEWEEIYKKPFIKEKSFQEIHNPLKKVTEVIGNITLKNLNTITIQNFLNSIPHNRTKERIELHLNEALKKAVALDIIDKNPFNAVQKTRKNIYKNYCFNYDEQQKIINAIKGTNIEHEIISYLIIGCRPAELPTKEDFDFENKIVNINGTKNKNAKRYVDLSKEYCDYMKNYFLTNDMKKYPYVQKEFKNICSSLNITNLILYRLRHTFASNHFVLGTQAKQVSLWMGHSSIKITLDTYTDIDKSITKDKIINLYNNYYILPQN